MMKDIAHAMHVIFRQVAAESSSMLVFSPLFASTLLQYRSRSTGQWDLCGTFRGACGTFQTSTYIQSASI